MALALQESLGKTAAIFAEICVPVLPSIFVPRVTITAYVLSKPLTVVKVWDASRLLRGRSASVFDGVRGRTLL